MRLAYRECKVTPEFVGPFIDDQVFMSALNDPYYIYFNFDQSPCEFAVDYTVQVFDQEKDKNVPLTGRYELDDSLVKFLSHSEAPQEYLEVDDIIFP